MRHVLLLAVVATSIGGASAGAPQTYSLKRVAKIGDTAKYRLSMDVAFGDMQFKMTSTSTVKVVRVDEDGTVTTQTSQGEYKIKIKGVADEMTAPDSEPTTAARKANGELVSLNGDRIDASSYRLDNLNAFHAPDNPVKVGDRWTFDSKGNTATGAVAGKAEFELLGIERVGPYEAAKVRWTYQETEGPTPATSEGTVWIDVKDGSLVKSEGKLKNAPLRDAPRPVDFSFITERIG
jgi:hypothetical protein